MVISNHYYVKKFHFIDLFLKLNYIQNESKIKNIMLNVLIDLKFVSANYSEGFDTT